MLEHDALRKVLYTEAISAAAAASLPCKIGDEPFVPPAAAIYGEFWYRTGKTDQMELGAPTGYECTYGVIQFSIFAPEKLGEGAALRIAGALKHLFNRKQWQVAPDGNVTIGTCAVQTLPGIKNGHKVFVVDASLKFQHRNPVAT